MVETGPRPASRPVPRWQKVTLAALAVVIASGWYADHRVARHEAATIAGCDRQLRSVSHVYDVRMGSMFEYLRPSYELLSAQQVSELMAQPARAVLPSAESVLAGCREGHVLPWHSANVARHRADLAYSTALVDRLRAVAGGQLGFQVNDRRLARLRAAAGIPTALSS